MAPPPFQGFLGELAWVLGKWFVLLVLGLLVFLAVVVMPAAVLTEAWRKARGQERAGRVAWAVAFSLVLSGHLWLYFQVPEGRAPARRERCALARARGCEVDQRSYGQKPPSANRVSIR